ncbi:hypothetical protein DY000_02039935 [Brassica cretica]|uniref:Uncharacterized protein n=1 Tax=Brassica cretica TaxID=69181 RepID=A0ABQ7BQJ0_BRACR|nr:hypothetical protein DY000_02039935 [Brassica cretica]
MEQHHQFLSSQAEAMQREIAEIQKYIASRPEASTSIDRRINKSTDNHTEYQRSHISRPRTGSNKGDISHVRCEQPWKGDLR